MSKEIRPFDELEIFEPHLRKKREYSQYIKEIRNILIARSIQSLGVKSLEEAKTQPLFGLWPPQVEALQKGFYLEKHIELPTKETYSFYPSVVVATGTGTGKTDIAALSGLKAILEGRGKVVYTVPYRALAREKETTFRKMWGNIVKPDGAKIEISKLYLDPEGLTGTHDYSRFDWLITTNEKLDSLIRHKNIFLKSLATLIVDEGDFISDVSRGPTLETVITRVKRDYAKIQIAFLSATIPSRSAHPLAFWLNLRPAMNEFVEDTLSRTIKQYSILTYWRPVKLINSVFYDGTAFPVVKCKENKIGTGTKIHQVYSNDILNITLHVLKAGGQVLIFRKSRSDTVATARLVAKMIVQQRLLSRAEFKVLDEIRIRRTEKTAIEEQLLRIVKVGVAFHHAGAPTAALREIEKHFQEGIIKVVVATTTLARGVNLPARAVILGDMKRYDPKYPQYRGGIPIHVSEYHQFMGRAGRFGKEQEGFGYSLADSFDEVEDRVVKYICAPSEELESQLYDMPQLRKHLLATVAIDKIVSKMDIKNFLLGTYLYMTEELNQEFWQMVDDVVEFLAKYDFIMKRPEKESYEITILGAATSGFLLDPLSVVYLNAGAELMRRELAAGEEIEVLGFLHLISFVEQNGFIQSRKDQLIYGWLPPEEVLTYHNTDPNTLLDIETVGRDPSTGQPIKKIPAIDFIVTTRKYRLYVPVPKDRRSPDYEYYLQSLFTAMVIRDWINEIPEDIITRKYVWVQPGDLFSKHERVERIADILGRLDELSFGAGISSFCDTMFWRIRKGIKPELISLSKIPDIGRVRARKLYNAGYKDRSILAKKIIEPAEYANIQKILGKRLAKKLLERLSRPAVAKVYQEEDKKLAKGISPTPVGDTLAEVTEKEELRKNYYLVILALIKEMWARNDMKPLKIRDITEVANQQFGISSTEIELIIQQMIEEGVVWVPVHGTIQVFT